MPLFAESVLYHKQRPSMRVVVKKPFRSPYISDMYGCLSFRCQSYSSLLHVFVKDATDKETLLRLDYIYSGQWSDIQVRLMSFTTGPYQVHAYFPVLFPFFGQK